MIDDGELKSLKSFVDIVALAERLGAEEIRREGRRFRACCMFHGERTGSLVLFPDQGTYHCFGCGANGDVVKMVTESLSCDFLTALRYLADLSGYWPQGLTDDKGQAKPKAVPPTRPKPRLKEDKRLKWHVITPVPAYVPEPRLGTFECFEHHVKRSLAPVRIWLYRDAVGQLLGVDARYEFTQKPKNDLYRIDDRIESQGTRTTILKVLPDGRLRCEDGRTIAPADALLVCKEIITWTWCQRIDDGHQEWRQRAWNDPSPLYGLDRLAARPTDKVLICEGCKAADAGEAALTRMIGMSWRGGCGTAIDFDRVDWSPLANRDVVIWPDADDGGRKAAWHIAQHCQRAGAASVRVVDTTGLPKGWDLADA